MIARTTCWLLGHKTPAYDPPPPTWWWCWRCQRGIRP